MSSPIDAKGFAALGAQAGEAARQKETETIRRRLLQPGRGEKDLRKACSDFEAIFINKMWQQMRNSVPKEGYLHSKQEDFYLSMFDHELSKEWSRGGGIGLGDMLFEQLKTKLKSASQSTAPASLNPLKPLPDDRGMELKPRNAEAASRPVQVRGETSVVSTDPRQAADALAAAIVRRGNGASETGTAEVREMAPASAGNGAPTIQWPLEGRVVREFGVSGPGVEIEADPGRDVRACMGGTVAYAGRRRGLGNVVVLRHQGGLQSVYGHLGEVAVKPGDFVSSGRKIAQSGGEGKNVRRVYFEIRDGAVALNPTTLPTG